MRLATQWIAAVFLIAATAPSMAQQAYPNRLITIIVPLSLGTGADIIARIFAAKMAEWLGVGVVVDNKPGAGSIVGTELAARAPADGYTLLMAPTSYALHGLVVMASGNSSIHS